MFKRFKALFKTRTRPATPTSPIAPSSAPKASSEPPVSPKPNTFEYYDIKNDKWVAGSEHNNAIIYQAQSNIGPVALKQALTYSIQDEADNLSLAQHPNIIKCYGVITDTATSKQFMMMEYMDAGDLYKYLQRHNRCGEGSNPRRVSLAIDFLKGLVYLHSLNFVHRDIKCQNILLSWTTSGLLIAKIADFETARETEPETGYYMSYGNAPVGTPGHIDPDVLMMRGKGCLTYTKKSDNYAAGTVLLQLSCDCKPYIYDGVKNRESIKQRNSNGVIPEIHSEVSSDDRNLILFCFKTPRSERPESTYILEEYARIHGVKL